MLKYFIGSCNWIKTTITLLALTLALGLPLLSTGCGVQIAQPGNTPIPIPKTVVKKKVLVLYAYQSNLISSTLSAKAIQEELSQAADLQIDLYFEYLDMGRFSDQVYQDKLIALLNQKYMQKSIDLVIVANQMMIKWWPENGAKILPETPVVFFDIDHRNLSGLKLPTDFTGVSGVVDYIQSVKWYLGVRPTVNEVVIVHGMGPIDLSKNNFLPVELLKQEFAGKLQVTDISNLPLAEIKKRVASLPPTSVLVYHLMFADADGISQNPINVLHELTAVSSVPVIGAFDQFIGEGVVGGYMYSIDRQARDAVEIALRILRGEKPADIPVLMDQSNVFIFDHLALQRYNIPLSALPADAVIKNRQYSFWELYQLQIIAAVVAGIVLLLMVLFLLLFSNRLVKARRALINLNASLETQVEKRTIDLRETNSSLEEEIIERRQIETALRESEQKYRLLAENMADVVWILDLSGKFTYVSQSVFRLRGFTPEEVIKTSMREAMTPDSLQSVETDLPRRLQAFVNGNKSERVRTVEIDQLHKNGSIVPTEVVTTLLTNDQGHVTQILGVSRDITARKQAEAALRKSEEQYRNLYEDAIEGIAQTTPSGKYINANRSYVKMFGYDSAEDLFNSVTDVASQIYANPDDRLRLLKLLATSNRVENFEGQALRKDGQKIWISMNVNAIRNQNGELAHIDTRIMDITERKRAEAIIVEAHADLETRVRERTSQLEAANHELEAFSYSISHDLRTPLRALDGFSGILLADYQGKLDEQAQDYLIRIRKASRHMWQLTEDLLALSHITRMPYIPQNVDLSVLVHEVADELQSLDPQRKVNIEITPNMVAYGDANLLKIVYENLLNNAYKFTGQCEQAHIQVGVMVQAGETIYFVCDNGAGFDMAYAGKLFTPFQRLHNRDEFPGTGIGLVTVKRIITRHGGRIWPEAVVGQGTTFYFALGEGR